MPVFEALTELFGGVFAVVVKVGGTLFFIAAVLLALEKATQLAEIGILRWRWNKADRLRRGRSNRGS